MTSCVVITCLTMLKSAEYLARRYFNRLDSEAARELLPLFKARVQQFRIEERINNEQTNPMLRKVLQLLLEEDQSVFV